MDYDLVRDAMRGDAGMALINEIGRRIATAQKILVQKTQSPTFDPMAIRQQAGVLMGLNAALEVVVSLGKEK